ncbi:YcbK family protein [Leptolyngbya sp. AN02str]|uniref:YcbK family protein n=1 Tax=Leptolyngbya sp. AN02str TaxID=3423363 RepID=UPI003D317053
MTKQILRFTRDSFLKRRPEHLGHLPEHEKYPVKAGTEYEIASYAWADSSGDFDEHIKFALKEQAINGFNTWFVFNRSAEVVFDGAIVYPLEEQSAVQILRITHPTILKRRPVFASELSPEEMAEVSVGTTFDLHSYAYSDVAGSFNDHIRFAINQPEDYIRGLSTWYVYKFHAQVEFDNAVVYPLPDVDPLVAPISAPRPAAAPQPMPQPVAVPQPVAAGRVEQPPASSKPPAYSGPTITLPGKGKVFLCEPIIPGGSFSWAEATHGGSRIPKTVQEVENIVALAQPLQRAREQLGCPFKVTSWYRPEPFNRRAGGVRNSQHLGGKAADLVVAGMSGRQVANAVMSWWPGGIGIYPGNRKHIVHLDVGSRRSWGF